MMLEAPKLWLPKVSREALTAAIMLAADKERTRLALECARKFAVLYKLPGPAGTPERMMV